MGIAFEDILTGRFVVEGSGGGATDLSLVVVRSGDLSVGAAYEWSIIPDTTLIGGALVDADDFIDPLSELPSGVVVFAAGEATATLSFQVRADDLPETDAEGFLLVVSDPGGDPEEILKQFYLSDDDTPSIALAVEPQVQQGSLVFNGLVDEDADQALLFRLSLSKPVSQPLTIFFSLADASLPPVAAGGFSFRGLQPTLQSAGNYAITLQPGQSSVTLEVVPQPDAIDEPDQTLQLRITSNAAYANAPAISGTIRDDDEPPVPSVTLAVAPAVVAEDGGIALVYSFRRTGSTAQPLTINYSVAGTALAAANGADPADYSGLPVAGAGGLRQVTFSPGAATATLQLQPIADLRVESEETVQLSLAAGRPLTVKYSVAGTALAAANGADPADYSGLPVAGADGLRQIIIPAGATTATLQLQPIADLRVESEETVQLSLAAGSGYGIGSPSSATGRISNDDQPPQITLAVAPAAVVEDGGVALVYSFRRTGSTTAPLTVKYSVAGTALAAANGADPADYSGLPGAGIDGLRQITFPAGAATATLRLQPSADQRLESEETVQLNLAAGSGYGIGSPSSATGRISNDDAVVSLSVLPAAVLEDGDQALTYTFRRTGATGGALTVLYNVSGRARLLPVSGDPADYSGIPPVAGPQKLVLPAGAASASVVLDPIADSRPEPDESLTLTLLPGSGYGLGATRAITGAILNDDATVSLAVAPAAVAEDGSDNLVYTFRRSGALAASLLVNVTVAGTASAVAGTTGAADYRLLGATGNGRQVLFAAGASTATLLVDPTPDSRVEPDETVTLSLAPGPGYGFSTAAAATGTITGDDASVTVRVAPAAVLEDSNKPLVYTFRRSGPLGRVLEVGYSVSGSATVIGSSGDPSDVQGLPASSLNRRVRFPIGVASVRVPVRATPDRRAEPDETLALSLQPGPGYGVVATAATATGVIRNDDPAQVDVANPVPIVIPDRGTASPYPATVRVDGLTGSLVDVSVNLFGIRHPSPEDLDILLLNPAGQAVMLLSDTGRSFDLRGIDLSFTQQASAGLPQSRAIVSGTYRPTDHGLARDVLPAPAPAGPYGQDLSLFRGGPLNGEWRLLVFDDARTNGGLGAISGGWSLTFTTV